MRPIALLQNQRPLVLLPLLAMLAAAELRAADFVVYYPDGPQDPSQMVAAFAPLRDRARSAQRLDLSGHYFVQLADFQKFVDSSRPAFALVDPLYFLENQQKLGLEALATPVGPGGQSALSYCLVVPAGKPYKRIDDLAGKTLAQTPLMAKYPYFVSEFLLEGAFPPGHFKAKSVASAPSALKVVELEEADAAFVPCSQAASSKKVRTLFTSRPIPYPILVTPASTPSQEKDKARELFLSLDKNAQLAKALQVEKFVPAPSELAKALASYRNNPVPTFEDLRIGRAEGQASTEVTSSGILEGNPLDELRTRFMPAEQQD